MRGSGIARALQLHQAGDLEGAVVVCRELLKENPEAPDPHHLMGLIEYEVKHFQSAVAHLERALALGGIRPRLLANLGTVLRMAGRQSQARAVCEQALERDPDLVEARLGLALSCSDLGDFTEAAVQLEQARRRAPDLPLMHFADGLHAQNESRLEDAIVAYQQTLRLQPGYAEASHNIGRILRDLGRLGEAEWHLRMALKHRPEDVEGHIALGRLLLLQRRWDEGWEHYEARHRAKGAPRTRSEAPLWQGADFGGGTLLVESEQGLGDVIQFCRYAPALREHAARILLSVPQRLVRLLDGLEGIDGVIGHDEPLPRHDARIFLLSVPRFFEEPLDPGAYLRADPERVRAWSARLPRRQGLRVGIAWQGNPAFPEDGRRSFPLEYHAALARVPGVELVSLQRGHGAEQLSGVPFRVAVPIGEWDEAHAFVDTAAILEHCDLVVTSDSALAHLAGALGRPTWVPLAHVPEWRWGLEGDHSPWYGSVRVFRQEEAGQWSPVFARMAHRLEEAADLSDPDERRRVLIPQRLALAP